jgi:hypothetical protein
LTENLWRIYREQAHSYKGLMSVTVFVYASDNVGVSLLAMKPAQSPSICA